jgi:2-oxoglutarate dehydrogenase E2 component (dihydrolipoamide succinyltransferase)
MSIELKVPEMGESVTEIHIGQWSKSEGEHVEQDEPLVELESEKATLDLHAPAGGVLAKIFKKSGDTAEVGEVIATIDERGDGQADEQQQGMLAIGKPAAKEEGEAAATEQAGQATSKVEKSEPPAAKEKSHAPAILHEKRLKQRPAKEAESLPPTDAAVEQEPPRRPHEMRQQPTESAQPQMVRAEKEVEPSRSEERVPMSPVRRRIATRLVEAQHNAALLTTFNEIDMTAVKQLRARCGESFERRHRVRLGFMSFFIKSTIDALEQCPELNAAIDGDDIVYRRYYDVGVAVSSDKGLVVPVLRNADQMTFAQIERAIDDLAKRAREGQLKVEELQGGTFTITNGGVFGSLLSTPIVNPPQSGVLGMHTIQDRPVVVNGEVVVRPMMYVALTYDHRIVDGRDAVTFLKHIKDSIEEPARLLIEV